MTIQHTPEERDRLIEGTKAMLMHAVKRDDMPISADMRVSEKDAAKLVGYAAGSFKNLRHEGKGPIFYMRPIERAKISYRLIDLAVWIEGKRESW